MGEKDKLNNFSMLDLFRTEVEEQCKALTDSLLLIEEGSEAEALLEALMRAAHSLKGAARMVGVGSVARLAHVMEDVFVAVQRYDVSLDGGYIDLLLKGVDTVKTISLLSEEEMMSWEDTNAKEFDEFLETIGHIKSGNLKPFERTRHSERQGEPSSLTVEAPLQVDESIKKIHKEGSDSKSHVLRVTAERWNQLMGLSAEVKVEAGRLNPYIDSLARLKLQQTELIETLDSFRDAMDELHPGQNIYDKLMTAQSIAMKCRKLLVDKTSELDTYERRINNLTERLHREAIQTRMRPFADGVQGLHRMVRDVSRALGKNIKLETYGMTTQVGRDILENMKAPLSHILRNAIDHGVESEEERIKAGKPAQATIRLSAGHSSGLLSITIEDDGRGIDLNYLRKKVVEKGHITAEMAVDLNEDELLEFLFLPNFSTRENVTEISGRGVGLDVVLDTVRKLRGVVHTTTQLGMGTRFQIQLPILLAVVPTLIVEIAGEPYGFPLARINHAVKVPAGDVKVLEDHQFVTINGKHIGLVGASEILGLGAQLVEDDELSVIIIGDHRGSYGVVVDRFIVQKELAIQSLDPCLGKIKDISSAAILEDGTPVLMIDVDELVFYVASMLDNEGIGKVKRSTGDDVEVVRRHVLVVDDSLTVREVERNLLETAGYIVDVAVDGMDGWNTIRSFRRYDLVIADVDMPRMDGIELVRAMKGSKNYNMLPVMIVSYKERAEDRKRGLDAGADYYLSKSSFHDNKFIDAVVDLIGEAEV